MLILYTLNFNLATAFTLVTFLSENVLLLTILGLILLALIYIVFRLTGKRKNKREVIPPVYKILGDIPERVDELNAEIKPFGFAYEPYQDIFYSLLNPWQRELGYCRLYDEASAALSMIIDCEPIPFEYGGRRWLIEFWKGQYCMNSGGEVGIYYTTGPNLNIPGFFNGTFYFCPKDEDCIKMSFVLRKNGNILFTRNGFHWWLTGFKLGEFSKPSDLSMDIIMELYDRKMAMSFVEALKNVGYKDNEYKIQGNKVWVRFDKPHTKQPLTRTSFTDFIMQRNNEYWCTSYANLTSAYTDTLDKLEVLRNESPDMYQRIMAIGKSKEVFESYTKLKNYIQ